jgi:hypothetical protein
VTPVGCNSIDLQGQFASAISAGEPVNYGCNGNCPIGQRVVYETGQFNYTGGKDCDTSAGHDIWDVNLSETAIGTTTGYYSVGQDGGNDGANYSTGHFWVCP